MRSDGGVKSSGTTAALPFAAAAPSPETLAPFGATARIPAPVGATATVGVEAMDDVCDGKDFSFPQQEERVLELWAKLDAFHEQLRRTESGEEFIFYDGPPFATGLPHYGHILAGTIKDVVTRHQSMRGRHVSRRFGWDCHGLPVEFEIDKALGITNRQQVFDLGIGKYNETCRSIVTKYVSEWEAMVTRTGRWIDFKNDYKTMDINFMESVWWVFAQLWEKDLVYKGFKVASLTSLIAIFRVC